MVILGDHVTTDSGTGIVHTAPGFGEDDYNVGIANGLEVAVTVDERRIKKKSLTHTHLTGVLRNQSSGVQYHNGLPQFLNSAKKSWTKLKK